MKDPDEELDEWLIQFSTVRADTGDWSEKVHIAGGVGAIYHEVRWQFSEETEFIPAKTLCGRNVYAIDGGFLSYGDLVNNDMCKVCIKGVQVRHARERAAQSSRQSSASDKGSLP